MSDTILGVILGFILGGVGHWFRWRREDRQRWHERRVTAYAMTLDRVTRIFVMSRTSVEAARSLLQPPWKPWQLRRAFRTGEAWLGEAQEALFATRLLGGPEVVAATERCLTVIGNLGSDVGASGRRTSDEVFERRFRELAEAREDLVTAARRELDVDRSFRCSRPTHGPVTT